jgi:ABC-type uncharacterized transport system substrate-binding protein
MQRRQFITLLATTAIATPRHAVAQTPAKVHRLAMISPQGLVPQSNPNAKFLLTALAQLGYDLGKNLMFESAAGGSGQAPAEKLLEQAKADKVEVIVAWGYPVVLAAKAVGIPTVVGFGVGDPVANRPRGKSGTAGGQHHRHIGRGDDAQHQAAGAAQGLAAETSSRRDAVEQGRSRYVAAL